MPATSHTASWAVEHAVISKCSFPSSSASRWVASRTAESIRSSFSRWVDANAAGNALDTAECQVALSSLQATHVRAMHPDEVGKRLLEYADRLRSIRRGGRASL